MAVSVRFLCHYGAQMFHLPNIERVISGRMDVDNLAGEIPYGSLNEDKDL